MRNTGIENMKFTCSICNKSIRNKDGHYIKYDKTKSVKVCKMHVPDAEANGDELDAYAFMNKSKRHTFINGPETNDITVCMICGYVRGEKPYQKCPMTMGGRNGKKKES